MKDYECWEIGGHSLEFLDESHKIKAEYIFKITVKQCIYVHNRTDCAKSK